MRDDVLTYLEMCGRERMSLQKGMNFRTPPQTSIFLMSQRPGAPYEDELDSDGEGLTYEGHDASRTSDVAPKAVDQPRFLPSGNPTDNGKFADAVDVSSEGNRPLVRVYEKLRDGIWSDRGLFDLVSYSLDWKPSEGRRVFRFRLRLSNISDVDADDVVPNESRRLIPSWVKQFVFKRDKGRCVVCGSQEQLHFDHDLPFSRGGSSFTPDNVRILCARHNLQKGARIE